MSRTYKDRPARVRYPEQQWDYRYHTGAEDDWRLHLLKRRGVLTKKRRKVDTEWHWMSTPGWWIRQFMNRPQRRAGHAWEHDIVKWKIEDIDLSDYPCVSRKPHIYYW